MNHEWEWREKRTTADCPTGKNPFTNAKDAMRFIRGMWRVTDATGLEPYLCECGYFHIGHATESLRERNHRNAMEEMG